MPTMVPAGQFKARCLAILDEVARSGAEVVITKRGTPVARLVPLEDVDPPSLLGSVSYDTDDDLLSPTGEGWDADR